MLDTNIKIKFKYLDTPSRNGFLCIEFERISKEKEKKNEMRRVYILKTRIGIKTNSSSTICTAERKKVRSE